MALSYSHEFHFIISKSMKKSLETLTIFKGLEDLSGIIVEIFTLLVPLVKREYKWGNQKESQYMYVSPDPAEKREHVHAYLPSDLYRELKLIHQHLNFFSIAQILRMFLDMFLGLVERFGNATLQELENIYGQWKKESDATQLTLRQYLRQLWKILQFLPAGNRLLTVYDNHFSPFWTLRL